MGPSIPFNALVTIFDAEVFSNGNIRSLGLPPDVFSVMSKLESQNFLAQSNHLNNESKPNCENTV